MFRGHVRDRVGGELGNPHTALRVVEALSKTLLAWVMHDAARFLIESGVGTCLAVDVYLVGIDGASHHTVRRSRGYEARIFRVQSLCELALELDPSNRTIYHLVVGCLRLYPSFGKLTPSSRPLFL